MSGPAVTDPAQREHWRTVANRVRISRADVLRALEDGDTTLASALAHPDVQGATVYSVIERLPVRDDRRHSSELSLKRIRRATRQADVIARRAQVTPTRKVKQLTDRQRLAIIMEWTTIQRERGRGEAI